MTVPTEAGQTQIYGRALIDGEFVDGTARGEVRNPADVDEVVGTYPLLTRADLDRAVEAATRAQKKWRKVPIAERVRIVQESAVALTKIEGLPELLTREQGKVMWESSFEIGYYEAIADAYGSFASALDDPAPIIDDTLGTATVLRRPVGVVAAIAPWNYPFALAALKVIPALMAGCAVILKPSPVTPLTTLKAFGAIAGVFPPGVLNVVIGSDEEVSAPLLAHPGVRKISLTGSTATGRIAVSASAATLKNVTLELGGNDAALVLDDAEIDGDLCASLLSGAFPTSGQVCVAIKRVYVPRAMYETLVEGLLTELETTVVGNGLDSETTMGPLTTARQKEIVTGLVDSAERAGAEVHRRGVMGADTERGHFLLPAILTGTPESHDLVQTEQFGPALPIQPYDTLEEALELVNATDLGLSASVWTSDVERGARVAAEIEAGTVHVNNHGLFAMDPRVPFGGIKQSGLGTEMGVEGLLAFTEQRVINTRTL
ncbi:aldehyde dehydrogenase family protein [Nocardia vaccinii]|uniref:aldehyde dehydrogenase family protein n=1 Tax=Nocardia vaccinii TaxID=1822 RepID=UPI0009FC03FF|nr:aldehyde dehydrogenase family protein [Nocardia vaccinii]